MTRYCPFEPRLLRGSAEFRADCTAVSHASSLSARRAHRENRVGQCLLRQAIDRSFHGCGSLAAVSDVDVDLEAGAVGEAAGEVLQGNCEADLRSMTVGALQMKMCGFLAGSPATLSRTRRRIVTDSGPTFPRAQAGQVEAERDQHLRRRNHAVHGPCAAARPPDARRTWLTCTTPLAPETNQFCYVMHADQNVPRAMDRKRSNRDVEIVTVENSASLVQMSKDATRARADISKRL